MFNAMTVMPLVATERVVFYRGAPACLPGPVRLGRQHARLPRAVPPLVATQRAVPYQCACWQLLDCCEEGQRRRSVPLAAPAATALCHAHFAAAAPAAAPPCPPPERAASMYAPGPYSMALGLAEIPWLCAQSLIMVNITYW